MEDKKQRSSGLDFRLHPLVMINISDHYTRMRANYPNVQPMRVMGCLLGSQTGRTVDISNSFEMNFSINEQGALVIDHAFLVKKQEQYKTVFPKQDVVGWYSTGAAIQETDMAVHKKIMELNESPVCLLLDPTIDASRKELPVQLHETELHLAEGEASLSFVRASYSIETSDAERIGVDQVAKILPGGKASGSEQLTAHLAGMHSATKMLAGRITMLVQLLHHIQAGEVEAPHGLLRQLAGLVHSLPALDSSALHADYLRETSDSMLALYLSTITKGIASLDEVMDKVLVAYNRQGAGAGGGPPHHAAGMGPGMGISRRRGAMGALGQMMGL